MFERCCETMKLHIFLLTWLTIFAHNDGARSNNLPRPKRDASGALHIVTNHAQPIHADVKSDNAGMELTEKPCPTNKNLQSHVESGVVFQVTPPEDTFYQVKSLRKSLIDQPTKIDLFRNIGRVVTLAVLVITAVLEFYPLFKTLYHSMYTFLYL